MAEVTTIARPYAEAVFALADKANALGAWSEMLARLAAVAADRDMQEVIANSVKTNEAISALAKGQFEVATAQAKAQVDNVTKAASKAAT